jgi:hypothetical protein
MGCPFLMTKIYITAGTTGDGKALKAGQTVEVSDHTARILIGFKLAYEVSAEELPPEETSPDDAESQQPQPAKGKRNARK